LGTSDLPDYVIPDNFLNEIFDFDSEAYDYFNTYATVEKNG